MRNDDIIDLDLVVDVWQRNNRLRSSTINVYLWWIREYREYCRSNMLSEIKALTPNTALEFAKMHSKTRKVDLKAASSSASTALRALSLALQVLEISTPQWIEPISPRVSTLPLINEFSEFLREVRGSPTVSVDQMSKQAEAFLKYLRSRRRRPERVRLSDVDDYVLQCTDRYARTTTAAICSALRNFLRFLHSSGRIGTDLSASVTSPKLKRGERPLRALPWDSVQKILNCVDRSTPMGQRDYCLLLMMCSYGMGAGEVIRVTLDDINWRSLSFRLVRPKTGVEFTLPLLPAVAEPLATYVTHNRPIDAPSRYLFLSNHLPHRRLSGSTAVRHILHKHARMAGVTAAFLGTHCLRHSHANRQMEQGTDAKLIGDILGHSHPESTSAYIRISTERLRALSLGVPL